MTADVRALDGRIVIIGAGIAGLMTALHLAPRPVLLVSKGLVGAEGSTLWAQGGLAAAIGVDDGADLHAADTLAAGDGLCDRQVVQRFTEAAPGAIEALVRLGVGFDYEAGGGLALGLEAAHSRRRIVHAGGDATGREIMRALVAAARRTRSIEILEGVEARRLLAADNRVRGVVAVGARGAAILASDRIVIATGGVGGLYEFSTNPRGSFGQGLALAAHAGAEMADLEFVQFHPTALDGLARPAPLVSEAVRGEGAILIDETGERFMAGVAGAELAPRDVVARTIWRRLGEGHRVYLDARGALGERFATRFPLIAELCAQAGIDPAREPIPVRPAAHYHMGGVAVDAEGRSSIDRPMGLRRGGAHGPARRQPARQQLAERSGGLRTPRCDQRRGGAGRAPCPAARGPDSAGARAERREVDPDEFRRRIARRARIARGDRGAGAAGGVARGERRSGGGRAHDRRRGAEATGKSRRAFPHRPSVESGRTDAFAADARRGVRGRATDRSARADKEGLIR